MPPDSIRELRSRWPGMSLVNTYGATETSGSCTYLPPGRALTDPRSVGFPAPTVRIEVLDEEGRALPAGQTGELLVRGGTVTRGYWRRADPPEFRRGGWLSGDIGVIGADGLVEVLDRRKELINRGGEKVFTIELENVLHAHAGVAEAAVVGVPDEILGEDVVAIVVRQAGASVTEGEVREHVRRQLADFKVPRHVIIVEDELPKAGSGKLDRRMVRELAERLIPSSEWP